MVSSLTTSNLSTTISPLQSGTTYYFTITAYNGTTPGTTSAVQSQPTNKVTQNALTMVGNKLYLVSNKAAITGNKSTGPVTLTVTAKTKKVTSRVTATINTPSSTTTWYINPGQDGAFWKQPFYSSAKWTTSGAQITALRNGSGFSTPTGHVHTNINTDFVVPWVIGRASDPLVKITANNGKSISVRIPVGTITELPVTGTDNGLGGADSTQPYLCWTAETATIHNADGTTAVKDSNTTITCNALAIDDGAGNIMCDIITGQPGTGNAFGTIQDFELTSINADPKYVIPHMLAYELDQAMINTGPGTQSNNGQLIWPLAIPDNSLSNTGPLNQGYTIGIPASVARPTGKTRGWYALFDSLQQFGWFFYNVSSNGCLSFGCYHTSSSNSALVTDISNSINDIMSYVCILNNQTGASSLKGYVPGATNAFPAPPPLDLSPTGGNEVLPSSFGAWYPSTQAPQNTVTGTGYDVKPIPGGGKPNATESAQGDTVTTVGPALYDATLESFTITSGGQVAVNGTADTTTGGGGNNNVVLLLYWNHNIYQENGFGNWYYKSISTANWNGPTTDPRVNTPSGNFSVKNGQIIDPNGNLWISKGINVYTDLLSSAVSTSAGAPLTNLFPGINHIRVQVFAQNPGSDTQSFNPASDYLSTVQTLTGYTRNSDGTWTKTNANMNIVVELEDHNQSSSGAALAPYGGTALTIELAWYTAIAKYYAGNPYVWFGSPNEVSTPNLDFDPTAVGNISTWEGQVYNAIRTDGGNNNIIQMGAGVGGSDDSTVGVGGGFISSVYTNMTNIVWELHRYMSGDQVAPYGGAANYSTALGYVTGGTGPMGGGANGGWGIIGAQTIKSADGVVPVIIGEWGPDTGNSGTTEAASLVSAISTVQGSPYYAGATAWGYYPAGVNNSSWDAVNDGYTGNPSLTTWGKQVASVI